MEDLSVDTVHEYCSVHGAHYEGHEGVQVQQWLPADLAEHQIWVSQKEGAQSDPEAARQLAADGVMECFAMARCRTLNPRQSVAKPQMLDPRPYAPVALPHPKCSIAR